MTLPKPPRPDGSKNEAGAIWCARHKRFECITIYKNDNESRIADKVHAAGQRCHWPAVKYNDRCRKHVGMPVREAHARGFARLTAFSSEGITNAGVEPPVTPAQAIMGMLSMSWYRVHYYAALLEGQIEEQGGRPGGDHTPSEDEPDPLWWLEHEQFERGEGAPVRVGHDDTMEPMRPASSGLVGHNYSAVKDIGIFATGENIRALVQLEQTERDRCAKLAEMAHKMGIAERQIRMAETEGAALVGMLRRILDRLQLTDEQRALVATVAPEELRRLRELDSVPLGSHTGSGDG